MSKFEKSFEKAMRAAAPQRALPGDLQLRRSLERTGVAHLGPVSVKIVQHPSGDGFAVETTVSGDRRYPREPPMSMEEAREFALHQLAAPRASQTEEMVSAPIFPGPTPSKKTPTRCGNPLCGAPLDERGACVDACGWGQSPAPRDPTKREYVPAGTLAARYRIRGISKHTAWGNFVRDTIVQPIYRSDPVDAKEFYRLYEGRSR